MAKTPADKVADQLVELTENHFFNPAIFGRVLADQPLYTTDRIMEMVAQIISYQAKRYKTEATNGKTSEGLFLAKELDRMLIHLTDSYKWQNLKLPQKVKIDKTLKEETARSRTSWVQREWHGETANMEVQRVSLF
jgi:hypothetical protein